MRTIRRNVFETNSSSAHSITITKNFEIPETFEKIHFDVSFDEEEFGRGTGMVYNNALDKARYLWTLVVLVTYPKEPDKIDSFDENDMWPEAYFPFSYNEVCKLVKYYLNGNCTIPDTFEYYDSETGELKDNISINHQSFNENNWLLQVLSSKEMFFNYLFGKDSNLSIMSDASWEDAATEELIKEFPEERRRYIWQYGNLMDSTYFNGKRYSNMWNDYVEYKRDILGSLKEISKNLKELLKNI